MTAVNLIKKFLPKRWQKVGKDEPLSIVLLLRKPHFFREEELRTAAERAWGRSFACTEGSMHCVVQSGGVTLLKAGPYLLNFYQSQQPYLDNPKQTIDWLPQVSQRQAWSEHLAFVAVDYMNYDSDVDLGYCVLAKLVAEMLDQNCTGVYMPRDHALTPNDGSLYAQLKKMAASRKLTV